MKKINVLLTGALLGALSLSTQAENKWTVLFDGKKVAGLRGYGQKTFPEKSWKVENGTLKTMTRGQGGQQRRIEGAGERREARGEQRPAPQREGDGEARQQRAEDEQREQQRGRDLAHHGCAPVRWERRTIACTSRARPCRARSAANSGIRLFSRKRAGTPAVSVDPSSVAQAAAA